MSDTEKPADPAPAPSPAPEAQPPVPPAPARPERPERRPQQARGSVAPVPSLEQSFGAGPRLRDLDKEIEGELEAAMSGLSDKDMYGEPTQGGRPQEPAG